MKSILFFFFTLILLACSEKSNDLVSPCKTSGDEDAVCIEIYKPVCGCDNVTYSNSCYAGRDGVTSWVDGECSG